MSFGFQIWESPLETVIQQESFYSLETFPSA
jgi:hypothetical protein